MKFLPGEREGYQGWIIMFRRFLKYIQKCTHKRLLLGMHGVHYKVLLTKSIHVHYIHHSYLIWLFGNLLGCTRSRVHIGFAATLDRKKVSGKTVYSRSRNIRRVRTNPHRTKDRELIYIIMSHYKNGINYSIFIRLID